MIKRPFRPRPRHWPVVVYLAFILLCEVLIILPGFLYFYFVRDTRFGVAALCGFLIGHFILATVEFAAPAFTAVIRLFRGATDPRHPPPESPARSDRD